MLGLGDTTDPLVALAVQVNRFGPSAPPPQRFVASPFPILATGTLDPALALVALTIYQQRATSAYSQFHDAGSAQALAAANAGFSDPTSFVQQNLADVTAGISGYADSLGLPRAAGDPAAEDSSSTLLFVGLAVAAVVFMRRSGRRTR